MMYKIREALSSLPDIDHEILDWLVTINSYKGVCTLASCAGHNNHPNQPFVVLALFGSHFYKFCCELSPVRSDVGPVLTLFTDKSWLAVFPPLKDVSFEQGSRIPPERLPTVRRELFERIIATLEKVIGKKASEKEIELKIKVLIGED